MRPVLFSVPLVAALYLSAFSTGRVSAAEEQADPKPPLVESFLISGKLDEGETALTEHLQKHPGDDEARFGLGVLQVMQGVEHLVQSLHKHGLQPNSTLVQMPFLRLPVPKNPDPEPISYEKMRKIYQTLLADLTRAEATLAEVKDDNVKLPLHFGLLKLDINGDGKVSDDEVFWKIYARISGTRRTTFQAAENFVIGFDKADVYWLRGYCHLLSAFNEFILAHDWQEAFNSTAHLFFSKVDSPSQPLPRKNAKEYVWFQSETEIADLIAFLHLISFEVKEPARMKSALAHLEKVIGLSRETWKAIEAETDNDREWIPNPRQPSILPGISVTAEMVAVWKEFLDEAEAMLKGEKLVPHWRFKDGRGINLRRVFTEPRRFDLILWVQGSSAVPYLEEGTLTERRFWERLQRIFRGRFMGFAAWFN